MSTKNSAARMRAKEIINDFQNKEGSFAPRSSTATTPSRGSTGGNSAEAARARMMQRQHTQPTQDKETYLQSISRRRWENATSSTGNILVDDD